MGTFVDVHGHTTSVWKKQGSGEETVLLLHGGLSDSSLLLDSMGDALAASRRDRGLRPGRPWAHRGHPPIRSITTT